VKKERPIRMPEQMKVTQNEDSILYQFRCDDRNGFVLSIYRAPDGDLHLKIDPDPDHEDLENNIHYISGSIRLRMPLIGGGAFEHLYDALVDGLAKECKHRNIDLTKKNID
jgi:hypothetical protein